MPVVFNPINLYFVDLVIVLVNIIDFILPLMINSFAGGQFVAIDILRMFKIFRAIRALRVLRAIRCVFISLLCFTF